MEREGGSEGLGKLALEDVSWQSEEDQGNGESRSCPGRNPPVQNRHLLNTCGKASVTSTALVVLSPPFAVGALKRKRGTAFLGFIFALKAKGEIRSASA